MEYFIITNNAVANFVENKLDEEIIEKKLKIDINPKSITNKYCELIYHPDGNKWAIPIIDLPWYGDVAQEAESHGFGTIVSGLTSDWYTNYEYL